VVATVEADEPPYLDYRGGVLGPNPKCGSDRRFGASAAGPQAGGPYWICKNAWGSEWGEDDYIRLARGNSVSGSRECGISKHAALPLGEA
jgi:hypothetical protein